MKYTNETKNAIVYCSVAIDDIDKMLKQIDTSAYMVNLSANDAIAGTPYIARIDALAHEMKKELKSLKSELEDKVTKLKSRS